MYKYAGIIVNNEALQLDKIFTYEIPENLINSVKIGMRVKVPFGKGNSLIDGFIWDLYENFQEETASIKCIKSIYDKVQLFTAQDMELIQFMRNKYLCSYIDCIKTMIPTGTTKGISNKLSEVIYIGNALTEAYTKEPYSSIYKLVLENNGKYNKSYLSKKFNISISSINTMLKHGFLSKDTVVIDRYNKREYKYYEPKALNTEQLSAVKTILDSNDRLFLIHGITGSGKTEIYMKLVSEALKKEEQSIILVPEISLTPQMVERFKGRFGSDISVFHSKLSDGERYDEWFRIKSGKVRLVVGARSAIFLPFNNLGYIIIDEEHESSYKSDSNPKYDAREIAEYKSSLCSCKVILGSATPSLETYYRCNNKEITLIDIKKRADNSLLPGVEIVDMRQELLENNKSIFSKKLYYGMKEALVKKEQIILFLNRRGFSTFVSCRKCGYVFKCEKCDISMTYHSDSNQLSCHYCGSNTPASHTCPKCGSSYVKYFGAGTEKIEAEVKKYFPNISILRMDFDTTRKKDSYENIYSTFKSGKAQILIGTQMIAKGLDFPNVTLVGVLAADLSLNLPDYKASERTFQLLTQVSGRAGRGQKEGRVIIQTYTPEHYSIVHSGDNDYIGFYGKEISIRKDMNYPPFSKIMLISFNSKNEEVLIKAMQIIGIKLQEFIRNIDKIVMLGPCPCAISKIKDNYRWQIIIKGEVKSELAFNIRNYIYECMKEYYNEVKLSIDLNPSSLL